MFDDYLQRAAALYSEGFLRENVRAFQELGVNYPSKLSALGGFVRYMRELSPHADRHDLIDLLSLSYESARLDASPSTASGTAVNFAENPRLDTIFLAKPHTLILSTAPLYSLWNAAGIKLRSDAMEESFIPNEAENVLIVKGLAPEVKIVAIASDFLPLLEKLREGASLSAALEGLDLKAAATEQAFIKLMSKLQSSGAFYCSPSPVPL